MDWKKYEEALVKRWESTSLLNLIEDKVNGALLLESQRLFNEVGRKDPKFNRLSVPLLVRLMSLLQKSGIAVEADFLPLDYDLEFPVSNISLKSEMEPGRVDLLQREAEDLAKVSEDLGKFIYSCVKSHNKNSIKIHCVSLKNGEKSEFENIILVNCEI